MRNLPDDPSQIFIAKAARIAETAIRQWRKPRTRDDLIDCAAVIRQRIRTGTDKTLKDLGFSNAGIRHFLETDYGLAADESQLLADSMIELVRSYNA